MSKINEWGWFLISAIPASACVYAATDRWIWGLAAFTVLDALRSCIVCGYVEGRIRAELILMEVERGANGDNERNAEGSVDHEQNT